ncbi:unnamed protein product, partial [marine sediment metagenome]
MKKQNKKKKNPNFLSWIVDVEKGLFSPLFRILPDSLMIMI